LHEVLQPSLFITTNKDPIKKRLKHTRNLFVDIVNYVRKFILLDEGGISASRTYSEWFDIVSNIGSSTQYWKTFPLVDHATRYTFNGTTKQCYKPASTNTVDVARLSVPLLPKFLCLLYLLIQRKQRLLKARV
jgi:hypothetical protein